MTTDTTAQRAGPDDEVPLDNCDCLRCTRARPESKEGPIIFGVVFPIEATRMFVCSICGNKRCPHSDDHRNPCSGSNEPGQAGSRYGLPHPAS